jgi:hypothetical protein
MGWTFLPMDIITVFQKIESKQDIHIRQLCVSEQILQFLHNFPVVFKKRGTYRGDLGYKPPSFPAEPG